MEKILLCFFQVALLLSFFTLPFTASLTIFSESKSSTAKLNFLILLDRDGVINEDVGAPGVVDPRQLVLTPGAGNAIARLQQAGCSVVIVTNQSCVGKGLISEQQLGQIQDRIRAMLFSEHPDAKLDRIYQCTSDDPRHPRRKPQPGMILEALKDYNFETENVLIVGDTWTDLQAAASAGIPNRILVATGYGKGLMEEDYSLLEASTSRPLLVTGHHHVPDASILPFVYCENLAQSVEYILSIIRTE